MTPETKPRMQLFRLSQLPDNWDSHNSPPYSGRHISHAKYLLSKLPLYGLNIYPNPGKSILFSYGNSDMGCTEFELFEDGVVRSFYKNKAGKYEVKLISIFEAPALIKKIQLEELVNASCSS